MHLLDGRSGGESNKATANEAATRISLLLLLGLYTSCNLLTKHSSYFMSAFGVSPPSRPPTMKLYKRLP